MTSARQHGTPLSPGFLSVVDVAPMPNGDHHDQQNIICDRVDDAVVANANPHARPSSQRARRRWARILSEERDDTLDAPANRRIKLLQGANRGRAQLDAVAHVQPRSALT